MNQLVSLLNICLYMYVVARGDIMCYITCIYSAAIILGFCIVLFININQ